MNDNTSENKKRYGLLDSIRGAALVSMVLYHLLWDMEYVLGLKFWWFRSNGGYFWQQATCWTFIFLSGFCWKLGRRPVRRGLMILAAGLAVTGATWIIEPERPAWFGILTMLAFSMFIMVPASKALERCPAALGALISFAMFTIARNVNTGYLGFGQWNLIRLPDQLYHGLPTTFLGFTESGFSSVDYFSLLPWFFLYVSGYFLYRSLKEKNKMDGIMGREIKWLSFLGRHSLFVYLIHQPFLYGCLILLRSYT